MSQISHANKYLVSPCIERVDGTGPAIELGALSGSLLKLTLGINHVLEQESISISIWGSASGTDWGSTPLMTLPQKGYCGEYHTILNLQNRPTVRFLRVEWKLRRWGKREAPRMVGFYVACAEASRVSAAVA